MKSTAQYKSPRQGGICYWGRVVAASIHVQPGKGVVVEILLLVPGKCFQGPI